jgi:hypothetical protein
VSRCPLSVVGDFHGRLDGLITREICVSTTAAMLPVDVLTHWPVQRRRISYPGTYSNIPDVMNVTIDEGDFGVDNYVELFYRNLCDWTPSKLRFDLTQTTNRTCSVPATYQTSTNHQQARSFAQESHAITFLRCVHAKLFKVHQFKLRNCVPLNVADTPEIPYKYESPRSFDLECRTNNARTAVYAEKTRLRML